MAPNHPDALHLLGLIAHQAGNNEFAIDLISKAIGVYPSIATYHNNLGNVFKDQGKLDAAIDSYRKALSLKPDLAEALYNLGGAFHGQGKLDEAVDSYRRTLMLKPDYAEAHYNLGFVLQSQGKLDEAVDSYQRTLVLKPDYAEAYYNLGLVLKEQGKLDTAIENYHRAILIKPDYVEAYNNLGAVFQEKGEFDVALESYRKALLFKPNYAEAYYNLGVVFQKKGELDVALESYHRVLFLKPDYAEAYSNLGDVFREQGKLDAAVESYRKALALKPGYAEAHNNLGFALHGQGKLGEAIESFRRALALQSELAEAHNNLGFALHGQGKLEEAIESFRKALVCKPDYAEAYSNLLFHQSYHALLDPREYISLARGWELACLPEQDRQASRHKRFQRTPLAGRRLRVGYVSGDYRQHAVSYFMEQLFAHHDQSRVELFAYSAHSLRDAVTERMQSLVEHWVSLVGFSDSAAVEIIERNGIDVLIDLSGHTAKNRLGIFARRASPVQAYYLGYFASTGLTEMDYWIGDEILTPPETDNHFSEQVWRLPRVSWSYDGKDAPLPDWEPTQDRTVWMGSFNQLGKLTPATLELWAKVLHALPEGHLLLKAKELADADNRRRIMDTMVGHGISPERIELQDSSATPDWLSHMAYYNRLDIALDPVGAHGGVTTTCDALWMGVPVITLKGDRVTSRATASILSAIGHSEWIAESEEGYLDKVVAFAKNVEHRKELRPAQRSRIAQSPLCDARSLARCLENAYFEMFDRWLEWQKRLPLVVP